MRPFSLCGGPDMPEGATIFLRENPNLFNVAVSRARAVLHVVGNREWALTCRVPFIEKLARRTYRISALDDEHGQNLQLQSLGWKVCRFWVYELREDLPRCVQKVISLIKD